MKELELYKSFTLIEPGPVAMVTTSDNGRDNVMVVSWNVVLDFGGKFALATGPWNYSFAAMMKNKECVLAIPGLDLMDTVIGIGTCSGQDIDKFEKFKLKKLPAKKVSAPLITDAVANIECRVIDYIKKHDIVVLQAVHAWTNPKAKNKTIFHYRGDGTFVADGKEFRRYKKMKPKMAPGL